MSKKNKMVHAKLIANPGSGTVSDRGQLLEQVTRCLQEQGIVEDQSLAQTGGPADGILLGKGTVRIKVLPGALRVIAPEVGSGAEKPPQATGADLSAPVAPVVVDVDSRENGQSQPESLPHVA